MNLTDLLHLPASSSPAGTVNKTDWLKVGRGLLLMVVTYAGIAVLEAIVRDLTSGAIMIPAQYQAIVSFVVTSALEMLRHRSNDYTKP